MKNVDPNTRSLIVTGIIGGFVLLYAFFVFLPTRRAIARMQDELTEKRKFILSTQKEFTEIGTLQDELVTARHWVAAWKENSPKRNNLGRFFGAIADISRTSGTSIERITPQEPGELKSLARHPVHLAVVGTFQQLFTFVQELEQMPFTVWIERLKLHTTRQTGELLTCELSLTVFSDNQGISD